jgi:hypothetical protein
MDNAKIVLHEHVPARVVNGQRTPGETKRIGVRDLGIPIMELLRRRGWKRQLAEQFHAEGWVVDSISVSANTAEGPHLVAYLVRQDATTAPERRHPTTRGGRPIADGPDLSKPSMSARLRKGR